MIKDIINRRKTLQHVDPGNIWYLLWGAAWWKGRCLQSEGEAPRSLDTGSGDDRLRWGLHERVEFSDDSIDEEEQISAVEVVKGWRWDESS